MKNLRSISVLLCFCVCCFSCSTEETNSKANALERELESPNEGVLQVDNVTYVFKSQGETAKFQEEEKQYNYVFPEGHTYIARESMSKHAGASILIENEETKEFIKLSHLEKLQNGKVRFDVELSTGDVYSSVTYSSDKQLLAQTQKWHDEPWMIASSSVVQAFMEPSLTSACTTTVSACSKDSGNALLALEHSQGWFTPVQACEVECL